VLTLEDYERAYGSGDASNVSSHLALPRLLEQIFTSRTLLFLGCSLKLDRTLNYLERVQKRHGAPALHFALLSDPGDEAARQLRAAFLAKFNIRPIWYPRLRHDLIVPLLEEVMEPKFMPAWGPPATGIPASRLGEYIAVDLGTSFSAAAYQGEDDSVHHCRLFSQDCGELTRTVVCFLSEYEYTIGDGRADPGGYFCEIRHFKRSLGSDHLYPVGRRDYSASDVAALFLKGVRLALEAQFTGRLPPVLVAIPANFSSRQVDDLARAVRRAGFRLERFVGEPCAAGLNLREFRSTRDLTFMVIDIGGGTTDISIIERTCTDCDFVFEIGCVAGDNMLGGVDFDEVICELVREHCLSVLGQYGLRVFELQRPFIEPQARALKDSFNKRKAGEVTLADVEVAPGRLGTLRVPISREQFANAAGALLARIEQMIDYALAGFVAGGFDPAKIEAVMLAGQGSKLTPIRRLLRRKLRLPIIRRYEESAVVRGLAQQAGILGARVHDRLLLDVMYHAIHVPLRPGMRAYRDYDYSDPVERFFRERKRDYDGRIDVVEDATGRRFLALVEPYESVPSRWSTRLELEHLVEQFELETFESGDNPYTPFLLRRKWLLRFSEPVGELRIDIALDLNRNVEVTLVLQHAYVVSVGSSEHDQRKVGKFYASMPG
jgi:actin-like ATPase involved in cell morphogenesis